MSTLQVANVVFESTSNNRIQFIGSNSYTMFAGGNPVLSATPTGITANTITTTGDIEIQKAWPTLLLDASVSGQSSRVVGYKNNLARWEVNYGDTSPETGNNAGSNYSINRYSDASSFLATDFSISRSTGEATFTSPVNLPAPTANSHAVRRQDVVERIGSISLVGLTAAAIAVPTGFRSLKVNLNGMRNGSSSVQQINLQVMINGAWQTSTASVYFVQLSYFQDVGGFGGSAISDVPSGSFMAQASTTVSSAVVDILLPTVTAALDSAVLQSRATYLVTSASSWVTLFCSTLVSIPANQRIEQIRVINIAGSPSAWTTGTFSMEGVRA